MGSQDTLSVTPRQPESGGGVMNDKQLYKREHARMHKLWQQKKIDQITYGLLLRGDCIIDCMNQIYRFSSRRGWYYYGRVR